MQVNTLNVKEKALWVFASMLVFGCAAALSVSQNHPSSIALVDHDMHSTHGAHEHDIEHDRLNHGKPGSNIRLTSLPVHRLNPGEERNITLSIDTGAMQGMMEINLIPDGGIALLNTERFMQIDLQNRSSIDIPVTVYGVEEGEYFVHVMTQTIDDNGMAVSRALATSIQVGTYNLSPAKYKMAQKVSTDKQFISLKAKETIN